MDKYYSYTDFLRAVGQSQHVNSGEKLLNEIYLDLFLNSIQRIHREQQLLELIDTALDEKDKVTFYRYTEELKELQELNKLE